MTELEEPVEIFRSFKCDWCDKPHMAKVTVNCRSWYLCEKHLLTYQERFCITDEQIKTLMENKLSLIGG